MLSAILRFLGSGVLRLLGLALDIWRAVYDTHKAASDTREVDRQQREQLSRHRQADAERAVLGAEADVSAAVAAREEIKIDVPETDEEGEQLAKRLGEKLS